MLQLRLPNMPDIIDDAAREVILGLVASPEGYIYVLRADHAVAIIFCSPDSSNLFGLMPSDDRIYCLTLTYQDVNAMESLVSVKDVCVDPKDESVLVVYGMPEDNVDVAGLAHWMITRALFFGDGQRIVTRKQAASPC